MKLLIFKIKKLNYFSILGIGLGWLFLSYLILGNPWITNKIPGIVTLVLGIISCIIAIVKRNLKNKDIIAGIFQAFLASVIIIYLTLFLIYFIAGFINI